MGWPGPLTHRQHLTQLVWDSEEWNRPDRGDHYLMRIAYEIHGIASMLSKGTARSLDHFRLKFRTAASNQARKPLSKEERLQHVAWQKAMWLGVTGVQVRKEDLLKMADGSSWEGQVASSNIWQPHTSDEVQQVLPTGVEDAPLSSVGEEV